MNTPRRNLAAATSAGGNSKCKVQRRMSLRGTSALPCEVGVGNTVGVRVVRLGVVTDSFTGTGSGAGGCSGRGVADGASDVNHHLPALVLVDVGRGG